MTPRPGPYAPPVPPDVPVPPVAPPRPATQGLGVRLRWWAALAGLELAAWTVGLVLVCWVGGGAPDLGLLAAAELVAVGVVCGQGGVWVALALRTVLAAFRATLWLWDVQGTALARGAAQTRRSRRAWDARWTSPHPPSPKPERLVIYATPPGDRARQSSPVENPATEHPTRHLPAAPPAYYGTSQHAIVDALLAGQAVSVRHRPGGMPRPVFEAAVAALVAAGVLVPRLGRGPVLAPDLAHLGSTPTFAHARIARRLGALPFSPTASGVPDGAKTP